MAAPTPRHTWSTSSKLTVLALTSLSVCIQFLLCRAAAEESQAGGEDDPLGSASEGSEAEDGEEEEEGEEDESGSDAEATAHLLKESLQVC